MNGLHQLVQFHWLNSLDATLGELNSEKVIEKEETAEKKRKNQAKKVVKKEEQENKYKETK